MHTCKYIHITVVGFKWNHIILKENSTGWIDHIKFKQTRIGLIRIDHNKLLKSRME